MNIQYHKYKILSKIIIESFVNFNTKEHLYIASYNNNYLNGQKNNTYISFA